MSASIKARATKNNVIMTAKINKTKTANRSGNDEHTLQTNRSTKRPSNWLAFLFVSGLLLIGATTIKCVSPANTTTTTTNAPSEPASTSIAGTATSGSLFNLSATTLETAGTSTSGPTTIEAGPTTTTPGSIDGGGPDLTTTSSETSVTIGELENGETSATTTAQGEAAPVVSPSSIVEDASKLAVNSSTGDADMEEGEGDVESVSDDRPASGEGKLSLEFILDTAGETADHILANLRPSPGASGGSDVGGENAESDVELPAESTGSESAPVERRDVGGENANLNSTQTTTESSPTIDQELKISMETYAKWRAIGDDFIELFSRKMLPVVVEHGYDIDAVTVTGLLQVFNGIRGLKPWALKLLDASAKITPGLLMGTQSDFGDFDECLNVRADDPAGLLIREAPIELDESTGLPTTTLVGRYCLADIEFPKPPREKLATRNEELKTDFEPIELRRPLLNFSQIPSFKDTIFVETGNFLHMLYVDPVRVGLCLTNKIDPDSFAKVVNKLLEEMKISINFRGRCVTKYAKIPWTIQQKISAWVILVSCSLVGLCTILDVLHTKLNKLPLPGSSSKGKLRLQSSMERYRPLFTSFSIIRNTKRLFRPQVHTSRLLMEQQQQQQQQQQYRKRTNLDHKLSQSIPGNCANSTSSSSYSSSESSPYIERRSSAGGSAVHLINESSIMGSSSSSSSSFPATKLEGGLAAPIHFIHPTTMGNESNLLCLHGIRVITMTWMIVNHTYLFGGFFVLWAYRRLIDISEWPKSFSFQLVLNGWLTVETYFFLGATILVLSVMQAMKAHKFTYTAYVLHRLIRLLPAYTGLICLNFLWPLISSGPVWLVKGKSFIQTPCENYLWTNYLFINNWIWPEKQCMVHSWFLSADFQLYLMAPLIVYLLYRRPVLGHTVNIIVAMVASIVSGLVIYANKLMPTTLINKLEFDSIKQQLSYSYFATYQHVGPYCLGIFTGYLLYKRPHFHLPKHLTWALWILLPPLSFTTLFLTYLWNGAYDEPSLINPSPIVSALYVAIHRTIWTSLVAWIVFACATGRAKRLSNFLSHSMFIPLSRLSFSIYLVHLPVIMYRALNLRHTLEWTDSNILWEACGNFIVSLIVGYFVNVTFESPFINLEQVLFGRKMATNKLDQVNSSIRNDHFKSQNLPKLRSQLVASSKATSENDSDDCKSAKSSELAHTIKSSSSLEQDTKPPQPQLAESSSTESQLLDGHMHRARQKQDDVLATGNMNTIKRKALRNHQKHEQQQQQELGSIYGETNEPTSMSHYGDVEDHNDDDNSDNLTLTPDSGSPVIGSSNGQSMRRNRPQQVAPVSEPKRRHSAFGGPVLTSELNDHSSSIYQMAPIEYQGYAQRRAMLQASGSGGGLRRISRYATLAPTTSSRFYRDHTRASERQEHQRPHHMGTTQISSGANQLSVGGSISRNNRIRPSLIVGPGEGGSSGSGLRRQGRYNTLTGTGSREWRQQANGTGSAEIWDFGRTRPAQADEFRPIIPGGSTNWMVRSGAMLPRIDLSTLRGAPLRNDSTRTSNIVEEERDDIIRI